MEAGASISAPRSDTQQNGFGASHQLIGMREGEAKLGSFTLLAERPFLQILGHLPLKTCGGRMQFHSSCEICRALLKGHSFGIAPNWSGYKDEFPG